MLNRAELRNRSIKTERRYKEVRLSDGAVVRLQSMTRSEQRTWRKSTQKKDGSIDPKRIDYSNDILLVMTIVDEKGEPAFTLGDAFGGMFDDWDTADTSILIDAAVDHCGLLVETKETEDAIKNSDETPGNDSSGVSAGKQD